MVASLGEYALEIILGLITNAIQKVVDVSVLGYFEQRKITRRVEDAVAEVVEPLLPFLAQEGVPEDKQRRLLQTCVDELEPLSQEPERLFQASLNGQKIFENLYANRALPEVVIEDGVKEVYGLLCPRIAELLCKVPAAIKEWETLAWAENYRRLDDLVKELKALFNRVDELQHRPEVQADNTLMRVRRALAQKIGLEMDITGLRGDQPLSGQLSEFFVHPAIKELVEGEENKLQILEQTADAYAQFVRPHQKAVIIGAPGAGKSTWTKWFQREILSPNGAGLGVRMELRNCSGKPLPSVYVLVRETAGIHLAEELTAEVIARWLDQHQLVFILDGFDEIRPEERDKVYAWIDDLCQATNGCPLVLTSRPLTTDHLERKDVFGTRWMMEPFDLPRIIEYIRRWYDHAPLLPDSDRNVNPVELASEWQSDPTLAPLTGNPLLLSTLLMVNKLDGGLPSGRSSLYQRYINGMLGIWDDRRGLAATAITLTLAQKKQILRGLALFMFLQKRDQLEEAVVLKWLQSFLIDKGFPQPAEDILKLLRERSGLIIGPGVYNFAHKSVAEYLVAEIVWDGDQNDLTGQRIDLMYLLEHRDDDFWNSVLFLWAGLASVADLVSFIDSCLDVENWALAYGILYDQFDRINDRETCRRLLMPDPLNRHGRGIVGALSLTCVYGAEGSPVSETERVFFKFESISLRGISQFANYKDLIELALLNRVLMPDDRLSAKPDELNHLLWFIYRPPEVDDVEGLKAYIRLRFPLCNSDNDWYIIVTDQIFRQAFFSGQDIGLAIEICHTLLPEVSGVFPLLLMSFLCNYVPRFHLFERYPDAVREILALIPESGKGKIYPPWLLGTGRWKFHFPRQEEVDLLDIFKARVNEFYIEAKLPLDEIYGCALAYVTMLLEKRTSLAAEMGIDLKAAPEPKERKASRRRVPRDAQKGVPVSK